ncbi:hypothetical protein PAXRUDRAFT_33269 [Paxillus rubicundulus Ve08.2h10]|uniref:Uncharacterized protein n=1 Tax=Paxillus rubicundulus Ve08.2h10 TaxID=930991 RepID=A0A0D0E8E5_9AGAM|nr:hypothetical protein PAXRUDRAFT_33269 [Paxillus rubicundulus Ve08.2h10]
MSSMVNTTRDCCVTGVPTFNAAEQDTFPLHAYIIFKLGDIIAVEKFLNIKGHNAIYPCRSCKIKAVCGLGKTHYVSLRPPKDGGPTRARTIWQPDNLPLRRHHDFIDTVTQLHAATTKIAKERIAKQTGIKDLPAMHRVGSLDYAQSVPWEWFHLLLENIIPNLVDFWTGWFKDLDSGTEDFEIAPHIWEEVGKEIAAAVQHIPASFVHVLSNIASDRSLFTAESWCFWFIYLAPKLLENRFTRAKYYKHMCELAEIMQITLQFSITVKQVDEVEKWLIQWVEKYYYQYRVERLPACTLTIHGLLHLGAGIKNCSPVWTTWTFYMEHPGHVLRPPYKTPRGIDPELQQKIANYIGQVLGKRSSEVKPHLPPVSFLAGKLRI